MWEKSFFKMNLMTGCWCSGSPCSPGRWRPLGTFWWVRQHEFCFWISCYTKLKVFRRGHQGFGRKGPKGPTLLKMSLIPDDPSPLWWDHLLSVRQIQSKVRRGRGWERAAAEYGWQGVKGETKFWLSLSYLVLHVRCFLCQIPLSYLADTFRNRNCCQ